jgi:hypothetical protein
MGASLAALADPRSAGEWRIFSNIKRAYRCRCQRVVFFGNTQCLGCQAPLGYEPLTGRVYALDPGPATDLWWLAGTRGNQAALHRRCANLDSPAGCNWLVKVDSFAHNIQTLCISCRLNRTIPDLTIAENGVLWGRLEWAKRRVISSLLSFGLPVASRVSEDPERGLAFDLLRSTGGGPPVLTGHEDGIVTLNIEEADDATRERVRAQMGEPYRTLVGHFRHETGHYYWDRLVRGASWMDGFRELFGDERNDYAAALRQYHAQGPPHDWQARFVSAYASAHPWEDWAETWAHYLHMVDTLATAMSFGLNQSGADLAFDPVQANLLYRPRDPGAQGFLAFLNAWVQLTAVMNELSRGMGQQDFYPFALPRPAVAKLQFIHMLVKSTKPAAGA